MRFAFLDGRIESVCPDQRDETWVVNLKKGIISALQNTQTRLDANTVTVEVRKMFIHLLESYTSTK